MISFVSLKIIIKLFCLVMSPTFQYHIGEVLGSLSNDDGDSNESGKKAIGLD